VLSGCPTANRSGCNHQRIGTLPEHSCHSLSEDASTVFAGPTSPANRGVHKKRSQGTLGVLRRGCVTERNLLCHLNCPTPVEGAYDTDSHKPPSGPGNVARPVRRPFTLLRAHSHCWPYLRNMSLDLVYQSDSRRKVLSPLLNPIKVLNRLQQRRIRTTQSCLNCHTAKRKVRSSVQDFCNRCSYNVV
jgi:hypothetical protein